MSEFAADWLHWLQPYFLQYGFWFVLLLLFLKSLPLIGPFAPGAMALVAVGWFGRQGQVSPYLLGIAAIIGTIAGDCVAYYVGRKAGDRLLRWQKGGKTIAALSERVRKEPALIFFCHFETILRAVVPVAAGLSDVPFRRWLLLNAAGAVLWVASFIAAGYFLSLSVALATGQTIGFVIIALVIVIALLHQFGGRFRGLRERAGR